MILNHKESLARAKFQNNMSMKDKIEIMRILGKYCLIKDCKLKVKKKDKDKNYPLIEIVHLNLNSLKTLQRY